MTLLLTCLIRRSSGLLTVKKKSTNLEVCGALENLGDFLQVWSLAKERVMPRNGEREGYYGWYNVLSYTLTVETSQVLCIEWTWRGFICTWVISSARTSRNYVKWWWMSHKLNMTFDLRFIMIALYDL